MTGTNKAHDECRSFDAFHIKPGKFKLDVGGDTGYRYCQRGKPAEFTEIGDIIQRQVLLVFYLLVDSFQFTLQFLQIFSWAFSSFSFSSCTILNVWVFIWSSMLSSPENKSDWHLTSSPNRKVQECHRALRAISYTNHRALRAEYRQSRHR